MNRSCLTVSPGEFAGWIWRDAEPVVTRNVGVANAFISSAEVLGERPSEWMAGWLGISSPDVLGGQLGGFPNESRMGWMCVCMCDIYLCIAIVTFHPDRARLPNNPSSTHAVVVATPHSWLRVQMPVCLEGLRGRAKPGFWVHSSVSKVTRAAEHPRRLDPACCCYLFIRLYDTRIFIFKHKLN